MAAHTSASNDAHYRDRLLGAFDRLLKQHGPLVDSLPEAHQPGPILLQMANRQQCAFAPLLATTNQPVSKVLLSLWLLCREMARLSNEAHTLATRLRLYDASATLAPPAAVAASLPGAEAAAAVCRISRYLPSLDRARLLRRRCGAVLLHTLRQIGRLHGRASQLALPGVHMHAVLDYVGRMLAKVAQLDAVIGAGRVLGRHWSLFKKHVTGTDSAAASRRDMCNLASLTRMIDSDVFSERLFGDTVRNVEMLRKHSDALCNFAKLVDELDSYVTSLLPMLNSDDWCDEDSAMSTLCLFVLQCRLLDKCDSNKRTLAKVGAFTRCQPGVALLDGVLWQPSVFLARHLPASSQQRTWSHAPAAGTVTSWLERTHQALCHQQQGAALQRRVCQLALAVHELSATDAPCRATDARCRAAEQLTATVADSWSLVQRLTGSCRQLLEVHTAQGVPLPALVAEKICEHCQLAKWLVAAVVSRQAALSRAVAFSVRLEQTCVARVVSGVRARLAAETTGRAAHRSGATRRLDLVACLDVALACQTAVLDEDTLLATRLSLSLCTNQPAMLRNAEYATLAAILARMRLLCQPVHVLLKAADCRFLLWRSGVLTPLMRRIARRPDLTDRASQLAAQLSLDVGGCLEFAADTVEARRLATDFDRTVTTMLSSHIFEPLLTHIEQLVRVDLHADLQLAERARPLVDGFMFCRGALAAGRVAGAATAIDLAATLSNRLERLFYQLAVVALHDVSKYAAMRHLLQCNFGVTLNDLYLPLHSLDSGGDLLAVARNLTHFIAGHRYHLLGQTFSGTRPASVSGATACARRCRSLAPDGTVVALSPASVARWLRAHGAGAVAAVVNACYQYLRHQLLLVARVLSGERLGARVRRAARLMHAAVDSGSEDGAGGGAASGRATLLALAEQLARSVTAPTRGGTGPSESPSAAAAGGGSGGGTDSPLSVLVELLARIGAALGVVRAVDTGLLHWRYESKQYVLHVPDLGHSTGHCGSDDADWSSASWPASTTGTLAQHKRVSAENVVESLSLLLKNTTTTATTATGAGAAATGATATGAATGAGAGATATGAGATGAGATATAAGATATAAGATGAGATGAATGAAAAAAGAGATATGATATGAATGATGAAASNRSEIGGYCMMIVRTLAESMERDVSPQWTSFYALVPPLMLYTASDSFCGDCGAPATGDAVVLGATLMLTVLGQRRQYSKLNWSHQVDLCLRDQLQTAERRGACVSDDGLSSTTRLTLERLQRHQRRHAQLNNAMAAAWLILRPK